jgi:hypothetical protein
MISKAACAKLNAVHIASETIAGYDPDLGAGLLGDKAHSVIFDNSKIKKFVPEFKAEITFEQGSLEIMDWYDHNSEFQKVDAGLDALTDRMIADLPKLAN